MSSDSVPEPTHITDPSHLPSILLSSAPLHLTFDLSPTILYAHPYLNIPPKVLRGAFVELRKRSNEGFHEHEGDDDSELIILLTTPTDPAPVMKRRKRIISKLGRGSSPSSSTIQHEKKPESRGSLELELVLTQTLLTARHGKLNKSATIWEYRRWLLGLLGDDDDDAPTTTSLDPLKEISIVHQSAEYHPGNYYAWWHARWVVSRHIGHPQCPPSPSPLPTLLTTTLSWSLTHPSDTSGWSYLIFLFTTLPGHVLGDHEKAEILLKVVRFADEIAWGHEALWGFVRTVLRRRCLLDEQARGMVLKVVEGKLERRKGVVLGVEEERERALQRRAVEWVKRFGDWEVGEGNGE